MGVSTSRLRFLSRKMQFALVAFIAVFFLAFSSSPPIGNTGAPGDGTCGNCHGGGNFPGSITWSWSNDPQPSFFAEFDTGVPNEFGYQMTILDDNDNPIGSYTNFPSNSGVSTSGGQEWLGHSPSAFSNIGLFTTEGEWDPQGYVGDLTVYLAINAANGNGNTGGDDIHLFEFEETIMGSGTPPTVAIIDFEEPECNGECTGFIEAEVTDGQAPFSYDWNDGQTTALISNLCAGFYELTVTDDNDETAVVSMTLSEPSAITASADIEEAGCFGETMGSIELDVSGGTPDYDFDWDGPFGNTCCIFQLAAGDYEVTITDDNDCEFVETFTVNEIPQIVLSTSSTMATGGGANGTATVTASGGGGNFEYDWNTGDETATITGLVAGTYTVTVTDDEDCEAMASVTVTGQACNITVDIIKQEPLCFGDEGTLQVEVTGLASPISYFWTDGVVGAFRTAVAGTYGVGIVGASGCGIDTVGIVLTQPDSLDVVMTSLAGASCANGGDGQLTVSILGGVQDYTIVWENGLTNDTTINGIDTLINLPDTLTTLNPGYFSYVLTDGNGCTRMDSFLISNNDNIAPVLTTQPTVIYLDANGMAPTLDVNSVVASATDNCAISLLEVSSPASFDCSDIGSSMVIVTAMDTNANSTSAQALVTVTDTIAPTLVCSPSINVSTCTPLDFGIPIVLDNCDSNLAPTLVAGLNPGSLFPTGATTVTYEAVDLCGNIGSCSFVVTVEVDLAVSALTTPATCGLMDGTIDIFATGGTPPYMFEPDVSSGVGAGTFTITVTDAGGCIAETTVVVEQVGGPTITGDSQVMFCPELMPIEFIDVTGGDAPYTVLIDGQVANTAMGPSIEYTLSGAGTFNISITDANGCASNTLQVVAQEIEIMMVTVPDINLGCGASIPASQIVIPDGFSLLVGPDDLLTAGVFQIIDNVCGAPSGTLTITGGGMLSASATTTPSACSTGTGSFSITAVGGIDPISYVPFGPDQGGLVAGNYSVTVTDATGCQVVVDFTIDQENSPSLTVEESIVCFGANNGDLTLNASGGTPPYSYALGSGTPVPGGSSFTFSGLVSGAYLVSVIDANGCSAEVPAVIREHPQLFATVEADPGDDCIVGLDELDVIAMGGVAPYDITTTLQSDNTILVSIIDAVGCTVEVIVDQSSVGDNLEASASVDYDCIDSAPLVEFDISGGCPPYETDFDPSINTQVGEQVVTITDSAGQSVQVTFLIEDIGVLAVTAPGTVLQSGGTPTIIDNEVTGGIAPFSFQWLEANGNIISEQSDFGVVLDSTQVVTLIVVDSRGCSTTTEVNIEISTATIDLDPSDKAVQVYPSPVIDLLTINISNPASVRIQLLDMTGQLITEEKSKAASIRMDVSRMNAGVYFIRMEFEDKIILKRFIKG